MGITKIQGAAHNDERGKLVFFNEFTMESIKRFYEINPSKTNIIRAWQGHLVETKWFYCAQGSFIMNLVPLDKKGNLKPEKGVEHFIIESDKPCLLKVPGGFASGFKAVKENSKLIVFSDVGLGASQEDDFRFPLEKYAANWSED